MAGNQIIILLNRHWYHVFFSVFGSVSFKEESNTTAFIVTFYVVCPRLKIVHRDRDDAGHYTVYRYAYLDLSDNTIAIYSRATRRREPVLDSKYHREGLIFNLIAQNEISNFRFSMYRYYFFYIFNVSILGLHQRFTDKHHFVKKSMIYRI